MLQFWGFFDSMLCYVDAVLLLLYGLLKIPAFGDTNMAQKRPMVSFKLYQVVIVVQV